MFNSKAFSTLCMLMLAEGSAAEQVFGADAPTLDLDAHPVRQELVDEVKRKTKKWVPREVKDNHFRHRTAREIRDGTLGNLEQGFQPNMTPKSDSDPFAFLGEKYARSQHGFGFFGNLNSLYQKTLSSVKSTRQLKAEDENEFLQFKVDSIDDASREHARVRESKRPKKEIITGDVRLPKHFFSRDKHPECKPRVLNQQMCGSCWAFSGAGMLEDRFCIDTAGQIKVTLSPQDMVNCDFENFGCRGGYMVPAVDFLITEGVAEYDCLPYKDERSPCSFRCDNDKPYDKYYCKPGSLRIETDIEGIQADIYHNGPVMVGLMVYEDLYSYQTGIYEYTAGGLIGGHSIRAVGWGHDDDGHLYWICQNQWTDKWGMDGYVNIKAGEIGIDYWSLSCLPDIKIKEQ